MRVAATFLALLLAGSAVAQEVPESLLTVVQDRDQMAESFAVRAADCANRFDTDHILFHGCIDWHSSVHANWALIRYVGAGKAALTDYPQLSWLYEPGQFALFESEMRFLAENPRFEKPYGRVWLLRLAIDADKIQSTVDIGGATRPVFDDLLDYVLDGQQPALSESYSSLSWALLNLYDYSEHFGLTEQTLVLKAQIEELYVRPDDLSCDYDRELGGFMAVCTNWAMLASRVLSQADYDAWLAAFIDRNGLPEPVVMPATAHEYGLNFSRAWGLWAMYDRSTLRNAEIVDAYSAHIQAGYTQFLHAQDDYHVAGHWVAQFGLFALQPVLD